VYKALQKSVANGAEGSAKAVLKAVKSLQSPTEKICERCGRQRRQGCKSLYLEVHAG